MSLVLSNVDPFTPSSLHPLSLFSCVPQWEWSTQDGFPGNIGTVLGNGGGDGWFRVQWDNHGSNSYQYTLDHQDIVRYNDPLENPIVSLFPQVRPPLVANGSLPG